MKEGVYRTICGFCHAACGLKVHVGSSGINKIEGDPDHPANKGYYCRKVFAIREVVSSEDRLRYPLRRTPNGFKRVSWDEALDFAAERLSEVREKYGPNSLVRNGGAPITSEARDGFVQFVGAFGSSNFTGASNLCMIPRVTAFESVMGARPDPDFDGARLIIFWGSNPVATNRFGSYCAYGGLATIIPRAKKRGVKVISIDPVRSETVAHADHWVRIRPGTDIALALAMINVIIQEELYDKEFVRNWTTGFDKLAEHVHKYTPAWAETVTSIPASAIADLARAYATTKPATICEGAGLDMYTNVVDTVRALAILIALTGNLDVPGGNVFFPFPRQSRLPTMDLPAHTRIWYERFPLFRSVPFPAVKEAILHDEEYRPRAMIVHHSNPVLIQANEARTREALRKLDFLMVNDIFLTATAKIADLVLPSRSHFERCGYRAYSSLKGGFLAFARPVADPPGEARSVFEVEYEIAKRMGLHHSYPFHDTDTWLEYMLKPTGVTKKRLDEEQIVYVTPEAEFRKYFTKGFQTLSGKVEFCSEEFHKKGYNLLPTYVAPRREAAVSGTEQHAPSFPLLGISYRPALFVHTKFRNIKALTQLYPEPLLRIHPEDAAERDIAHGDIVTVLTALGRVSLKGMLTEEVPKGFVAFDFGWGNPTDGKASLNLLTDDSCWDPVSGSTSNRVFACEVIRELNQPKSFC